MKIAIVGYGKMGRRIAELAPLYGFQVGVVIDTEDDWETKGELIDGCDVALEFSVPEVAKWNVERLLQRGLDVVCGTTGWQHSMGEAEELAVSLKRGLMISSNFSVGMNVFFLLNQYLADLLGSMRGYTVSVEEVHHKEKLDSPSGTARKLIEDLKQILGASQQGHSCGCGCKPAPEIPVNSIREGEVTGTHTVLWTGEEELVSIRHEALNRDGFVKGALAAARWIKGKQGRFSMYDLLFEPKN
jgi:4-hydroxy-tetrahydrodipicolinate reductase